MRTYADSCARRTRSVLFLLLILCTTTPVAGGCFHLAHQICLFLFFYSFLILYFLPYLSLQEGFSARPVIFFIFNIFLPHLSGEEGFTTRTTDEISVNAHAADFVGRRRIHEPENERLRRCVVHRRHEHVAADRDPLGGGACCVPAASEFLLLYQ